MNKALWRKLSLCEPMCSWLVLNSSRPSGSRHEQIPNDKRRVWILLAFKRLDSNKLVNAIPNTKASSMVCIDLGMARINVIWKPGTRQANPKLISKPRRHIHTNTHIFTQFTLLSHWTQIVRTRFIYSYELSI